MPIFDRTTRHSVSVLRSNLHDASRSLNLRLESGGTASIPTWWKRNSPRIASTRSNR